MGLSPVVRSHTSLSRSDDRTRRCLLGSGAPTDCAEQAKIYTRCCCMRNGLPTSNLLAWSRPPRLSHCSAGSWPRSRCAPWLILEQWPLIARCGVHGSLSRRARSPRPLNSFTPSWRVIRSRTMPTTRIRLVEDLPTSFTSRRRPHGLERFLLLSDASLWVHGDADASRHMSVRSLTSSAPAVRTSGATHQEPERLVVPVCGRNTK